MNPEFKDKLNSAKDDVIRKGKAMMKDRSMKKLSPLTLRRFKMFVISFWILFFTPWIVIFFIFLFINMELFGPIPTFEELENPNTNVASQVIAANDELLGKYFKENRNPADFKDLSPNLINALVATEDIRFYDHSGVDFFALGRVLFGVLTGSSKGGGSTLSQQLAKNIYGRDTTQIDSHLAYAAHMAITKFKEWVTAAKLEHNYTKNEILSMYLNTVGFGSNAFGINSASRTFFNKSPDKLTIEEAAVLVGMLKAPSAYNPKINPDRSLKRREVVLKQMKRYDFLTREEYDSLRALPIVLDYKVQTHREGLATYFREFLRTTMTRKKPQKSDYYNIESYREDSAQWADNPLFGWCNKNTKPDGTNYDLYRDGLRIYTTIDSRMQKYAEDAMVKHMGGYLQKAFQDDQRWNPKTPFAYDLDDDVIQKIMNQTIVRSERYGNLRSLGWSKDSILKTFNTPTRMTVFTWKGERDTMMTPLDSIKYYKRFLHAGFVSIEPQSGHVKAYVGDINYEHFKFDNVSLAKRQVGSTFKPFIYTLAMMPGELSPCYKIPNVSVVFELPKQTPDRYEPKFSTSQALKKYEGKMISLKFGLAQSLNQVSAYLMKKYGPNAVVNTAHRMGIKSYVPEVVSLCVGSCEVTLLEMVSAYGTYANKGIHTDPIFVTRIEDKNGNLIAKFDARKNEAISDETAYKMLVTMQGVIDGGTSTRLRYEYGFKNQIAGKTGTTNDNSDGWFIGMTPDLVSGGWVGGEERTIRFRNDAIGQGAGLALPMWAMYMQKVYADKGLNYTLDDFQRPLGLTDSFDCSKSEDGFKPNDDDFDDSF